MSFHRPYSPTPSDPPSENHHTTLYPTASSSYRPFIARPEVTGHETLFDELPRYEAIQAPLLHTPRAVSPPPYSEIAPDLDISSAAQAAQDDEPGSYWYVTDEGWFGDLIVRLGHCGIVLLLRSLNRDRIRDRWRLGRARNLMLCGRVRRCLGVLGSWRRMRCGIVMTGIVITAIDTGRTVRFGIVRRVMNMILRRGMGVRRGWWKWWRSFWK